MYNINISKAQIEEQLYKYNDRIFYAYQYPKYFGPRQIISYRIRRILKYYLKFGTGTEIL